MTENEKARRITIDWFKRFDKLVWGHVKNDKKLRQKLLKAEIQASEWLSWEMDHNLSRSINLCQYLKLDDMNMPRIFVTKEGKYCLKNVVDNEENCYIIYANLQMLKKDKELEPALGYFSFKQAQTYFDHIHECAIEILIYGEIIRTIPCDVLGRNTKFESINDELRELKKKRPILKWRKKDIIIKEWTGSTLKNYQDLEKIENADNILRGKTKDVG